MAARHKLSCSMQRMQHKRGLTQQPAAALKLKAMCMLTLLVLQQCHTMPSRPAETAALAGEAAVIIHANASALRAAAQSSAMRLTSALETQQRHRMLQQQSSSVSSESSISTAALDTQGDCNFACSPNCRDRSSAYCKGSNRGTCDRDRICIRKSDKDKDRCLCCRPGHVPSKS